MRDTKNPDNDPGRIEGQPAIHKPAAKKRRAFYKILPIVALLVGFLLLLNQAIAVYSPLNRLKQSIDLTVFPASQGGIASTKIIRRSSTSTATTSYHVQGKVILDNQGLQYIPYGVHSTALFEPNWQNSVDYKNFTLAQMQAAREVWHSNVVAFQVAWTNLFPDQNNLTAPDPAYLQAMDTAVTWANQEHMNVIFNLQSEAATNEIMATSPSIRFWQVVANRYKDNQRVFFDVFNEPRDFYDWNLWQSGGIFQGVHYVGMQQLVDTIRATGAQNLIMVQGQGAGESFDYANFQSHLLHGTNIVYAIHPYLSSTQHQTQLNWEQWWGQAVTNLNVPFVVGEWNETPESGCVSNAPAAVPVFLKYVQQLHIGLIAWALTPGSLIRSTGNPADAWDWSRPTQFDQSSQVCADNLNYPYYNPQAQGAGELIMEFLAQQAVFGFSVTP
jgi:endoglucanase